VLEKAWSVQSGLARHKLRLELLWGTGGADARGDFCQVSEQRSDISISADNSCNFHRSCSHSEENKIALYRQTTNVRQQFWAFPPNTGSLTKVKAFLIDKAYEAMGMGDAVTL